MPSVIVQARLAPELAERLDRAAEAEHRTRANLVAKAVIEYLDNHHPEG
jgi:predicted transcriptional regulator